jgi:hypothetical protein
MRSIEAFKKEGLVEVLCEGRPEKECDGCECLRWLDQYLPGDVASLEEWLRNMEGWSKEYRRDWAWAALCNLACVSVNARKAWVKEWARVERDGLEKTLGVQEWSCEAVRVGSMKEIM